MHCVQCTLEKQCTVNHVRNIVIKSKSVSICLCGVSKYWALFAAKLDYLQSIRDHDDVIKWKHFPRNWPFVWGIHRSPVDFTHNGQWRGALMFSLICACINDWVNNREAGDLRRQRAHYDIIVMRQRGVYWLVCDIQNKSTMVIVEYPVKLL